MEQLYKLVQSLTAKELRIAEDYLQCFSSRKSCTDISADETLTKILFDFLLREKQTPSENDCCIVVYGTHRKGEKTFLMLKNRLQRKLLEAINSELNTDKKELLDEVDYYAVQIKKKSSVVRQLYYSKPGLLLTYELLEEIIADCRKYELYAMLIEHLEFKKFRYAFKEGKDGYEKINKEIEAYELCYNAFKKANDYYYEWVLLSDFSGKYQVEKVQAFLKRAIAELSLLSVSTGSNMVKYFLKYFEMDYCMNEANYIEARSICLELLAFIQTNPCVYRAQRLGIVHNYLSRCELFLGNYPNAVKHSRMAQQNFLPGSDNYSIAREQEFYALFYDGRYDESQTAALSMIRNAPQTETGKFRYAKYNFLHACVLFQKQNFLECHKVLDCEWELSKDKNGWELGLRILSIMVKVELLQYDDAGKEVANLKRFIIRTQKRTPILKRAKLIHTLLAKMQKIGFMFTLLNGRTDEYISILASKNKEYKWEILTPELIPFHEWAKEKIGKRTIAKSRVGVYMRVVKQKS